MKKVFTLKDGTKIVIRPIKEKDIERSFKFFSELPKSDRNYLRVDVSDKKLVAKRIQDLKFKKIKRLIALDGDRIVADGALELEDHGWEEHIGEIRLIVAKDYRRKGLGMIMSSELYNLAAKQGVEELVAKMMKPQAEAQNIFHRLGFHHDLVMQAFVMDQQHHKQDLIIMRCKLKELWSEVEDYFYEKDMRHMVTHVF